MDNHPLSAVEPPERYTEEISQDPTDPTNHGWSAFEELDMGTNPAGTQVPPFDSQRLEHWHAWETQPE
eukprot:14224170-Heterocapsa_arctica.AAC.1